RLRRRPNTYLSAGQRTLIASGTDTGELIAQSEATRAWVPGSDREDFDFFLPDLEKSQSVAALERIVVVGGEGLSSKAYAAVVRRSASHYLKTLSQAPIPSDAGRHLALCRLWHEFAFGDRGEICTTACQKV